MLLGSTDIGDKALHYGAYTVPAGIPACGFAQPGGILWAVSMILLGVAFEFAQKLAPGRSFEFGDMIANTLGVFSGRVSGWWDG